MLQNLTARDRTDEEDMIRAYGANLNKGELAPLLLQKILWTDEKHEEISLGGSRRKKSRRTLRDDDGNPSAEGQLAKPHGKITDVKYKDEARLLFGGYIRVDENNNLVGEVMNTFDYSGKKVLTS